MTTTHVLGAECGVPFQFGRVPGAFADRASALGGNPADFFACCGLLELAARKYPEARGRVLPDGRFELSGCPDAPTALLLALGEPRPDLPDDGYRRRVADAAKERLARAAKALLAALAELEPPKKDDEPKPKKESEKKELGESDVLKLLAAYSKCGAKVDADLRALARIAAVRFGDDGPLVGWWRDTDCGVVAFDALDPTGFTDLDADAVEELRLPDVRALKTWSGQTVIADKVRLLLAPVREAGPADLFEFTAPADTPPLFFDPRIKARALDLGFEPNNVPGYRQPSRPAVDVLALIGLETCRPVEVADGVYAYWPWAKPLTAVEARGYVGGWRGTRAAPMTFRLGHRNKYLKCWEIAAPGVND